MMQLCLFFSKLSIHIKRIGFQCQLHWLHLYLYLFLKIFFSFVCYDCHLLCFLFNFIDSFLKFRLFLFFSLIFLTKIFYRFSKVERWKTSISLILKKSRILIFYQFCARLLCLYLWELICNLLYLQNVKLMYIITSGHIYRVFQGYFQFIETMLTVDTFNCSRNFP